MPNRLDKRRAEIRGMARRAPLGKCGVDEVADFWRDYTETGPRLTRMRSAARILQGPDAEVVQLLAGRYVFRSPGWGIKHAY